jgi:hypothetical protein
MFNLKLEIEIKNIQREEIQLSLNQTQLEFNKLKKKNKSNMSTQYDDYKTE